MATREAPGQLALLSEGTDVTTASRSDSIYGTHAYHTKVPPTVAAQYINQHCPADGVVLDPFCGSGMTGVGALMAGRSARLSDLSPAAVHVASNYTQPCDPSAFQAAVARVLRQVGEELFDLYRSEVDGEQATVEYVVWSDHRACPQCGEIVVLWDLRAAGLRELTCGTCGFSGSKTAFRYAGERAVETSLSAPWARKRIVRPAEPADQRSAVVIPEDRWFPTDAFDRSRPMWRKSHEEMGVTSVDGFFSKRNLAALAGLWWAIGLEEDERVRSALRFSLTAIINRASRRYQWNAKRPTNVLGGTLYISSLRYEWNVLSLWRRKVAAVTKMLASGLATERQVEVQQASARMLPLSDASIDYCFTDPPFGAHIVYSDASLLWEAWLGDLTDRAEEAIVVSTGDHPKGVVDYEALLGASFAEIRRVLKPEARATVVFQATDAAVWAAILDAATDAGLHVIEATTLNKGQPSFKQIKGTQAGERVAHSDVVLTFAKQPAEKGPRCRADLKVLVAEEVRAVAQVKGAGPSVGHVYAVVAAAQVAAGERPLSFDAVAGLLAAAEKQVVAVR